MHRDLLNYYTYMENLPLPAGGSFSSQLCSHDFCARLHTSFRNAYRDEINIYGVEAANQWDKKIVGNKRSDILNLMLAEKYSRTLRYTLSNPVRHNLWYGFDRTAKRFSSDVFSVDSYRIYDVLLRFYEAVGGRCHQEERRKPPLFIDVETLIKEIEKALKIELVFPAPYAKMMGLVNKRGILRERALWSLYLAWKANQKGAKNILELGGGLGYAAFFSSIFGAKSYSIIDIPLTLVASAHFLALTQGEDSVYLYGEEHNNQKELSDFCHFNLLPPHSFNDSQKYDIVVNMDSFPEFGLTIAKEYIEKIKKVTGTFLSINHEGEKYTVRELLINDPDLRNYSRSPFWLRKGYVEEIFEFK